MVVHTNSHIYHTLVFQNVCKTFNNLRVLKEVSFNFKQNKTYALIGPSGAGKSTLIYLLSGLDTPTSGTILFDNQNIHDYSSREKKRYLNQNIGLIFQQPYLISELSVLENVLLKVLVNNSASQDAKDYAYFLLKEVNLEHKAHVSPTVLSGGEQQRVAIARALFYKPAFILADEPTAHLDYATKDIILELLLSLKNEHNIGLILATHDHHVAKKMDVVLELNQNRLLQKML